METILSKPVFVVGVPRSGTTLLSTILSTSPDICIAPEIWYFNYWLKKYQFLDIKKSSDFDFFVNQFLNSKRFKYLEIDKEVVGAKIKASKEKSFKSIFSIVLKEYAEFHKKERVGEKTPGQFQNIGKLLETFPDCKIVCMLRSPYAVVASTTDSSFGTDKITKTVKRWKRYIHILNKFKNHERVSIIKYEDLILNFESVVPSLSKFLEISIEAESASKSRVGKYTITTRDDNWANDHFNKALSPISKSSIEKWKTKLSSKEVALINYYTKEELANVGYEYEASEEDGKSNIKTFSLIDSIRFKLENITNVKGILKKYNFINKLTYKVAKYVREDN